MEKPDRRPQLPGLGFLESEKLHREPLYTPSVIATSPASQYPNGPPPPYSHFTQSHDANSGVRTPPDSRRTSGDEKEATRQIMRQSLPSISEALGVDSQSSYSNAPLPSSAVHAGINPPLSQSTAAPSPSSAHRLSQGGLEMQPTYQQTSTYAAPAPYISQQYTPSEPRKPAYDPTHDSVPQLHPIKTSNSPVHGGPPPPSTYQHAQTKISSKYEEGPSQSAGSVANPTSFTYGYTPYPPRYGHSTPPTSATSAPIYQPSVSHAAPPTLTWKNDQPRFVEEAPPFQHNESVKRHLDFYDLEEALNDIAQTSDNLSSFSRRYRDQMHHAARAGPTLSSLPSVPEVDDLLAKTRLQADALAKIRDVVLAQHTAYEQQVAEQSQQRKAFATKSMPPPEPPQEASDLKTIGFAGGEAKKRRGRAAPPGRCHSCNRAETPEWRRGPDGARTLCNACGLHYAKVTRKMNQQNKQTVGVAGSSNLRPKDI